MEGMRGFIKFIFLSLLISVLLSAHISFVSASGNYFELKQLDERIDGFYIMKDLQSEEKIMSTARLVHPGDEYINMENKLYRVEKIDGNIAWARFIEDIELLDINVESVLSSGLAGTMIFPEGKPQTSDFTLGIYHSHGAESYVPSDGTDSIPQGGGILEVGKSFAGALREKGFTVKHSLETHIPHDAGAYNRSRRTAEEFLKEGVDSLFDIHRDAVPAEEYTETVDGSPAVQLQLVVGRQNQNAETNKGFAEGLKKTTDDLHPGLIKGIFLASGNYNQDMLPLAMLIEVGSHENTKEGAEKSIVLFSDTVATYFLGSGAEKAQRETGSTALRSILWVVFIVAVALGVYLLISTKNIEELRSKLSDFFRKEFAELKGGKRGEGGDQTGE